MIRFTPLMVAVAATLAVSSAQALVVVVDDFNTTTIAGARVFDHIGGDAGFATAIDGNRTIRHKLLTPAVFPTPANYNADGDFSSVRVGASTIPSGALSVRNEVNVTSAVTLEWALGPFIPLPTTSPVSLYFKVLSSDEVPKSITASASFGNIGSYSVGLLPFPGQTVSFALSAAEVGFLNGGGTFSLTLGGDLGWDISLDEVGFSIPEPSVLGLAGLALVGAGLASRRRRA